MNEEKQVNEVARETRLLDALLNVSAALLNGHEPCEALQLILQELHSIGFDRVRVYVLSEDGKTLRAAKHVGMGSDFEGLEWQLSGDDGPQALLENSTPRLLGCEAGEAASFEGCPSDGAPEHCAYMPLRRRGRAVGLISADNAVSGRPIGEQELRLLSLFASQVVATIENNPFAEMERRSHGLQSILQIYSSISSSLDFEQTLRTACRAAAHMTGADHSGLVIFEEGLDKGRVRAEFPDLGLLGLEIPLRGVEAEEELVKTLEPIVVNDVAQEPSLGPVRGILAERDIRSILIVPVIGKNGPLGSFSLDALHRPRRFSDEEVRLCKAFAAQVAVAIENARLYEHEKLWSRQLDALRLTTLDITSQLNRKELLRTIIERAVALLEGKSGGIYEYHQDRGELTIIADYNRDEYVGKTLKVGEGMAGRLVLEAEPPREREAEPYMIVNDYNQWPGRAGIYADSRHFGAVLEVPLKWQDRTIGILYVDDAVGRVFTRKDAHLLRLLADQAAIALTNASLTAGDEAKLKKIVLLSQAAGEFLSDLAARNLDERLTLIAKHATKILDAEVCGIFLVHEEGWLSLEASYGHVEGGFTKGLRLPIQNEPRGGLSGYIAWTKELFNAYGEELVNHRAAARDGSDFSPSGKCTSLLAIPLTKSVGGEKKVVGLLRVSNKVNDDGEPLPTLRFTEEDKWIVRILAEAVVIAIDNSELVHDLTEQKLSLSKMEEKLTLLLRAAEVVAQADSLDEGLQNLSEMVVSLLGNTFCRILLLNESGNALEAKAAYPIPRLNPLEWEPKRGVRILLAEYKGLKEFLEAGEPIVLRFEDERARAYLEKFSEQLELTAPVRSLLAVPLKAGDEVIGLLNVGENRAERNGFDQEKIGFAAGIASQIVTLIRRLSHYERRRKLLIRLDNATRGITGKFDREKIYQETVTLAVGMVDYEGGALFVNHPQRRSLELCATFGLEVDRTDPIPYGAGPASAAAETGKPVVVHHYSELTGCEEPLAGCGLRTVITLPLKHAGEVKAVLLIGDKADRHVSLEADLEVLERFVEQAAVALQTSALVSREKVALKHLEVLHQISYYVMAAKSVKKVVDAVLTGITAGYGLGFNRAVIFLLDEIQENLIGYQGIGHLVREDAVAAWEADHAHGHYDLRTHLDALENGAILTTPVGASISGLCLPVGGEGGDLFSRAVREGNYFPVAEDFSGLPEPFRKLMEPTSPVVVVPLSARGQSIGLLVVDNKFTRSPTNDDDIDALLTFANTAAMAVENIRLFKRLQRGREKLRLLFTASTALSTSREPRQVLEEIVEQTRIAAEAVSVSIVLSDEMGRMRTLITKGAGEAGGDATLTEDYQVGLQVMRSGDYQLLQDREGGIVQAHGAPGSVSCRRLCLPLVLHGQSFGWMWISYEPPRVITEFEIDALQLYVNHAAVAYDSARRMDALNHMRLAAEAMAGAADAKGMLEQIVRSARVTLQADSAALWTYDAVRNTFVPEGWVGSNISPELKEKFWSERPSTGGTAYTVMSRGSVCVEDTKKAGDYPFLGDTTRALLARIGVQSFMGISLTVGSEPLGVLYVNFNRPRQFSMEEQQTALTFANHAALALKKARLLEQVTKAKNAAEAVARVTVLGNRGKTLESIARETKRALDADIVVLYEYDKASHTLLHPPTIMGLDEPSKMKAMMAGRVVPGSVVYWVLEKDEPVIVERVEGDPMFKDRRFAQDEGVRSCVAIPLKMSDRKLGVMFVNYRMPRRFTPDELSNMNLFSNQAAVAIFNAQLFDARNAQLIQQGQLLNLSRELLGIVSLLETIDKAAQITADILGVDFCAIVLPDGAGSLLLSASRGWPDEMVGTERLQRDLGSQSGFTIHSGAPVVVEDYSREYRFAVPSFVRAHGVVSGASAPMFVAAEQGEMDLVGVLLVHSKSPRSFSEEEQNLLSLIANETGIAIQRTRQYEELKVTRWRIGARTALAWMGMVNNYYQHTIVGHGNKINAGLELMKALEKQKPPEEKLPAWVEKYLADIALNARKIVERPITPPLSSEEGAADVNINQLVAERLWQLWKMDPYKGVRLAASPDPSECLVARISREWLRRALDILIDNAVRELTHVPPERREMAVTARPVGREIEILVTDRGRGFPKDIADQIFKGKIEKHTNAEGLGMGLLMAQAIIETYGGKLDIQKTSPDGTSMGIWLPLKGQQGRRSKGEI